MILGIVANNLIFESGIHQGFYLQNTKEKYIVEEIDLRETQKNNTSKNTIKGMTLGSLMGASVLSANSMPENSDNNYSDIQGGIEADAGPTTLYGNSLLVARSPVTTATSNNERNEIITYKVKDGDNGTLIAARFGITVNTLLWANKLSASSIIRPGNELIILPVSGVSHKIISGDTVSSIATRYKADKSRIMEFNSLPADGSIKAGDVLIIPDGEIYIPKKVYVATPSYSSNLQKVDGYFIVPTTGRNWGILHPNNAVDIANSCGTPIYAAAGGTVAVSDSFGWNGGYGMYIKINHPNGTATLYAHNSKNLVSAGEYVTQGQLIALMGTTGRSTGCHAHFEVRGATNPFIRY
jgi:LysM repeat protein